MLERERERVSDLPELSGGCKDDIDHKMIFERPSNALTPEHLQKGHFPPEVNPIISHNADNVTTQIRAQNIPSDTTVPDDNLLVASPYTDPAHLLDLTTLDKSNQILARALSALRPTRDDYATACYLDSFNWSEVIDSIRRLCRNTGYSWTKRSFYVIVFRSQLYADADAAYLYELDAQSHREAIASGGLYVDSIPSSPSSGPADTVMTGIWRSQQDARLGGTGPWHQRARLAIGELYERIGLTRLKLEIGDDVKSWGFSEWKDEDNT